MVYIPETVRDLRQTAGTLLQKVASENALIAAAIAAIDGSNANTVIEGQPIGGLEQLFMLPITAGANATTDFAVTQKIRVLDVEVILRSAGVASAVFTVGNTANIITDSIAASGAINVVTRAGQINPTYYEIPAGGKIRIIGSGGATMPAALIVVRGVRVA